MSNDKVAATFHGGGLTYRDILNVWCPTCGVPDGWACHPLVDAGFHPSRATAAEAAS